MSKQDFIDFVEKVQNDPKWKDEADMVLLKNRYAASGLAHLDERLIWEVLDELKNICLDTATEDGYGPTHGDAKSVIYIVKKYLD